MSSPEHDELIAPKVKVAAAIPQIAKGRDLLERHKGDLLALRPLRFTKKRFKDRDTGEPAEDWTTCVELGVIDLSKSKPRVVGTCSVSWTRVVRQLLVADQETWQIGVLEVEPEFHATVFNPPPTDVDLDAIAASLEELGVAFAAAPPVQLELPIAEESKQEADDGSEYEWSDGDSPPYDPYGINF